MKCILKKKADQKAFPHSTVVKLRRDTWLSKAWLECYIAQTVAEQSIGCNTSFCLLSKPYRPKPRTVQTPQDTDLCTDQVERCCNFDCTVLVIVSSAIVFYITVFSTLLNPFSKYKFLEKHPSYHWMHRLCHQWRWKQHLHTKDKVKVKHGSK